MESSAGFKESVYTLSTCTLAISSFVVNLGFGLTLPYFPLFAIELGAEVWHVGFLVTAFIVGRVLFNDRAGRLSDTYGRKLIINLGALGYAAISIFMFFIIHWTHMLVLNFFWGMASAFVWSPSEACLVDQVSPKKRGEALSLFFTLTNFGWVGGPAIGGLAQHYAFNTLNMSLADSFRFPFYIVFVLSLLSLVIVRLCVQETRGKGATCEIPSPSLKIDNSGEGKAELPKYLKRNLYVFFFAAFANGFSWAFLEPLLPIYLTDKIGAIPLEIGIIFTTAGLCGIFVNYPSGRMSDKFGRKPLISVGMACSRTATLLIPAFSQTAASVTGVMGVRSVGFNVSQPALRALQADQVPYARRGQLFGRIEMFFDVGMIIGSLISPPLYSAFGSVPLFTLFGHVILGEIIPFAIPAIMGITALVFILMFVLVKKESEEI
ncbi:MAG: MFS transporter [Candidatus Sifarchaeia archaeon]|jgi:MFS family permease